MTKESGEYIVSPFKPAAPLAEESQQPDPVVEKENPNETTVEEESKDHSSPQP